MCCVDDGGPRNLGASLAGGGYFGIGEWRLGWARNRVKARPAFGVSAHLSLAALRRVVHALDDDCASFLEEPHGR